jgi:DNA gyrase inhibitor GyrI
MKTNVAVIPGGLTPVLQLFDVSMNKTFKDNIRKLYTQWMAEGGYEMMSTGKIRGPSTDIICPGL